MFEQGARLSVTLNIERALVPLLRLARSARPVINSRSNKHDAGLFRIISTEDEGDRTRAASCLYSYTNKRFVQFRART